VKKYTTNRFSLPTPLSRAVFSPEFLADNELAGGLSALGVVALAVKAGMAKRNGRPVKEILYALLLWPLLGVTSIHTFCGPALKRMYAGGKDALYGFLGREDLNRRGLHAKSALGFVRKHRMLGPLSALVADDAIKERSGKKMEGVSGHFDHLTKRTVRGEQVLTPGLACGQGFVPIDAQIYISSSRPQELRRRHRDGRSHAARRFREAVRTKIETLCGMLRRVVQAGFAAKYFLADSWFAVREVIRTADDCGLVPVLRMKNGPLKFWVDGEALTAREIYARFAKPALSPIAGFPRLGARVPVVLNLAADGEPSDPHLVHLLFVRGLKPEDGKKSRVCFPTTEMSLSAEQILEVYALRWGIEVYFKEVKQHLGLLKEQTQSFASHIASRTAMRAFRG